MRLKAVMMHDEFTSGIASCSSVLWQLGSPVQYWAARYNTWLLIKLTLQGAVFFPFLVFIGNC